MAIQNPLKTESPPVNPILPGTVPAGGTPYKVKDRDDWASVAQAQSGKRRITAQRLIFYNFMTLDPAEVNYYLRVNVGCQLTDGPKNNWKFSGSADPGYIYIPPTNYDFESDGEVISGKPPLKIDWATGLDDPAGGHAVAHTIEIAHLVAMGLEIGAGAFVLGTAGVVLLPLVVLLVLEGAHADAIASAKKLQMKKGYSLGVVLAANAAKPSYVKNHFIKHHPVPHPVYKDIGKDLQAAFNTALVSGYNTAQQLNGQQVKGLFGVLHARMGQFATRVSVPIPKSKDEWTNFSDKQKTDYYFFAALAFEQLFLR